MNKNIYSKFNHRNIVLKNEFSHKREQLDIILNEIKQHPCLLNPLIEKTFHEINSKGLNYLDSELYYLNDEKQNEEDEEDKEIISKLFENKDNLKVKKDFIFNTLNDSLIKIENERDNKLEKLTSNQKEQNKSNKPYSYSHFKWLFKQNVKANKKNNSNINNLENKIHEFCKWAENKFDCKELELDAITLMKIFLVNYDKGPAMWVPINIEEINDKKLELELNISISRSKQTSKSSVELAVKNDDIQFNSFKLGNEFKKNCNVKWYLPKKNWFKNTFKSNQKLISKTDLKSSSKLLKYTGVKLFSEYFSEKKNGLFPYFLNETRTQLNKDTKNLDKNLSNS